MVLANPEIANLPAWVVALVAAEWARGSFTAAGLLLVISSSVSDLGKSILNPNMSEKSELRLARVAAGGAVILAGYFIHLRVLWHRWSLLPLVLPQAASFGHYSRIFSKRTTKEGARGLLCGLGFTAAYIYCR